MMHFGQQPVDKDATIGFVRTTDLGPPKNAAGCMNGRFGESVERLSDDRLGADRVASTLNVKLVHLRCYPPPTPQRTTVVCAPGQTT
jgi:hypothetical protein